MKVQTEIFEYKEHSATIETEDLNWGQLTFMPVDDAFEVRFISELLNYKSKSLQKNEVELVKNIYKQYFRQKINKLNEIQNNKEDLLE